MSNCHAERYWDGTHVVAFWNDNWSVPTYASAKGPPIIHLANFRLYLGGEGISSAELIRDYGAPHDDSEYEDWRLLRYGRVCVYIFRERDRLSGVSFFFSSSFDE